MNLPVSNRQRAILQAVYSNVCIAVIVVLMTVYVNGFNFGIWFILAAIIGGAFHIIKNNIRKAVLDGENIRVLVNRKTLIIPISEIESIVPASCMENILKGTFRITYFIEIQKKYSFGSTLLLGFISKKIIPEEPIEIKIIKSIMVYKKYKPVANNAK